MATRRTFLQIGLSRTFAGDHEQLCSGALMYDALRTWRQDNAHTRMHG